MASNGQARARKGACLPSKMTEPMGAPPDRSIVITEQNLRTVYGRIAPSRRSASRTSPDPAPHARHHTLGIPLILAILVNKQINLFRQGRKPPHPRVDLLRLAVAGQRLQPVDVVAIHDPWLVVLLRRDGLGNGGLGSGDLLDG